jgi:hypothetical protein
MPRYTLQDPNLPTEIVLERESLLEVFEWAQSYAEVFGGTLTVFDSNGDEVADVGEHGIIYV